MGTVVRIEVVGHCDTSSERAERDAATDRAFGWFREVEACASRFDVDSEVGRLAGRTGEDVPVSPMLLELVRFALALASETDGAFDPTLGALMESRGDNVHYRTGAVVHTISRGHDTATWRSVHVDAAAKTVSFDQPLLLDLGGVAKGLAIDLAARELAALENFAIDAGGDLYFGGMNDAMKPWSVGIRHPREPESLLQTLMVSEVAVCTSGDYERRHGADDHHLIDPGTRRSARGCASATVIAPTAMVADALATAAFILGPGEGIRLLERHAVEGLLVSPDLAVFGTPNVHEYFA